MSYYSMLPHNWKAILLCLLLVARTCSMDNRPVSPPLSPPNRFPAGKPVWSTVGSVGRLGGCGQLWTTAELLLILENIFCCEISLFIKIVKLDGTYLSPPINYQELDQQSNLVFFDSWPFVHLFLALGLALGLWAYIRWSEESGNISVDFSFLFNFKIQRLWTTF